MTSTYSNVAPNIGYKMALSKRGVAPVKDDIIGDIENRSGGTYKVNHKNTTPVSSETAIVRSTPVSIEGDEFSFSLYLNNDNYTRIHEMFHGVKIGSPESYLTLTEIYPIVEGVNDSIPNYSYDVFLTELGRATDTSYDGVQSFPVKAKPVSAPYVLSGGVTGNTTTAP